MDMTIAARCLEALGSPTRLEVFRLLVQSGPEGAVVGDLQERLGIPASTLSHHLSRLVRVGLISQERQSRTLVCRANYERMNGLLAYLSDNCCGGLERAGCDDAATETVAPVGARSGAA